jgi:transcriptional regulator with XRE-family HTH domain
MAMTLKAARVNKSLSQEEAAKLLGISKDSLSNYERGKTFPDVPVIKRLENLYGIGYDELIFLPIESA